MNPFDNYKKIKNSFPLLVEKFLNNPLSLNINNINHIIGKEKGDKKYNYVKLFGYYKNLLNYLIDNGFGDIDEFINKIPANLKNLHYNNINIKNIKLEEYEYNNSVYQKINNELKNTEIIIFLKDLIKEVYKLITGDYIKNIIISDKKNLERYVKWRGEQMFGKDISEEDIKKVLNEIKNTSVFINIDNIDKKDIFNNVYFFFNQLLKEFKDKNFLIEKDIDFVKLIANDLQNIKPFLNDYYFLLPLTYLYIFENNSKLNDNIIEEALFQLKRNKSF